MSTRPFTLSGSKMHPEGVDLRKEQEATLARECMKYTPIARFFYWSMDLLCGKILTLPKIKLIEILASIPYRAWENKGYWKLTNGYANEKVRALGEELIRIGRLSQDNEYWHLLIACEKIKEDNIKENWFLYKCMPYFMTWFYAILSRMLAFFSIRGAYHFNAMFEDHAEHEYAQFVKDHPELDEQPMNNELVKEYGDFKTWGDVFRTIGLDERLHMNDSLKGWGHPDRVVPYVTFNPTLAKEEPKPDEPKLEEAKPEEPKQEAKPVEEQAENEKKAEGNADS